MDRDENAECAASEVPREKLRQTLLISCMQKIAIYETKAVSETLNKSFVLNKVNVFIGREQLLTHFDNLRLKVNLTFRDFTSLVPTLLKPGFASSRSTELNPKNFTSQMTK